MEASSSTESERVELMMKLNIALVKVPERMNAFKIRMIK